MGRSTRRGTRLTSGILASAVAFNACVPHVTEQVTHAPEPTGSPVTSHEVRPATPRINASVSGNVVAVKVQERKECRETTRTPIERVDETKRTLDHGTLAQGVNLGSAAILLASGIAVVAAAGSGSCTTTPASTASDPNPSAAPCTAAEQQKQTQQNQGIGIVIAASSVIPLGIFVWNVFRAKDERHTEALPPKEETSEWEVACETNPATNVTVTLTAGGATISAQTDERGEARLDLSPLSSSPNDPQNGMLDVDVGGNHASASVSLASAPAYSAWMEATIARNQQADAQQQQRDAQLDRAVIDECIAKLDAVVSRYEHLKNATDSQARDTVQSFFDIKDNQCGLRDQVQADPRFAAILTRAKPIVARVEAARTRAATAAAQQKAAALRGSLTECTRSAGCDLSAPGGSCVGADIDQIGRCTRAFDACVHCCLKSNVSATEAHCNHACGDNMTAYVCR